MGTAPVRLAARLAAAAVLGTSASDPTFPTAPTFPDSGGRIALLVDQLPFSLSDAQLRFAATHYVGTQKLFLPETQKLRALNPAFVVLHVRPPPLFCLSPPALTRCPRSTTSPSGRPPPTTRSW